ncbi:MAG: RND transporter, partial [Gemmatimonadota bacterium]
MDIKREPRSKRKRYILIGAAVLVLGVVTVALARLEPAPPTVDVATIWTDTVVRGSMVREVRGPGTLVPEQVQLISAVTAGAVEEIPVQPGAEVEPSTVLLELSNPDVLVGSLRAEQSLTDAEAQIVDLRSNLTEARLSQRALVAQVRANYLDAERTAENNVP